jgi:hypothetical protein
VPKRTVGTHILTKPVSSNLDAGFASVESVVTTIFQVALVLPLWFKIAKQLTASGRDAPKSILNLVLAVVASVVLATFFTSESNRLARGSVVSQEPLEKVPRSLALSQRIDRRSVVNPKPP